MLFTDARYVSGRAGAPAQLLEGRAVHRRRGGGRHLHDDSALAGESSLLAYSVPAVVVQTRHQASHSGTGTIEGGVLGQEPTEPESARGVGADRAGLRQPARGLVAHQASHAHAASIQGEQLHYVIDQYS